MIFWKNGKMEHIDMLKEILKDVSKMLKINIIPKLNFIRGQKVGVWNNEPQQKIVSEINHGEFVINKR